PKPSAHEERCEGEKQSKQDEQRGPRRHEISQFRLAACLDHLGKTGAEGRIDEGKGNGAHERAQSKGPQAHAQKAGCDVHHPVGHDGRHAKRHDVGKGIGLEARLKAAEIAADQASKTLPKSAASDKEGEHATQRLGHHRQEGPEQGPEEKAREDLHHGDGGDTEERDQAEGEKKAADDFQGAIFNQFARLERSCSQDLKTEPLAQVEEEVGGQHHAQGKDYQQLPKPQQSALQPCLPHHQASRAAATSLRKSSCWPRWKGMSSGCHCTPIMKGCLSFSIAWMIPRSSLATARSPRPSRSTAW